MAFSSPDPILAPTAAGRVWSSRRYFVLLGFVLAGTLLLRLPTFFEPPWHSDEGIFAAVAQKVLHGGSLYDDAWESKPPLFLFLYVGLFKVLGPGVFALRLASTASALLTEVALYALAVRLAGPRRALIAPAVAGLLLSVPFWEGTLALTEIFAILPTTLAVLCVLVLSDRDDRRAAAPLLLLAGLLFGVAFLLRQTTAGVAPALLVWLFLTNRRPLLATTLMSAGFLSLVGPIVLAFAVLGSFHWFLDANVGFFFKYVPSGQELPFGSRPVIVLPLLITLAVLAWSRTRTSRLPAWGLPALWLGVTLAGAMLTGRPYSHYMLQIFPPLGLCLAFALPAFAGWLQALRWRSSMHGLPVPALAIVAALALTWGYVITPMFGGNVFAMRYTRGPTYYANFAGWALGVHSQAAYDNYFDRRVIPTEKIEAMLDDLHARGQKVFIWGEYPWLYPLADLQPTTRYMTSFYVLLIPYVDLQLERALAEEKPQFIILLDDAKPKFHGSSPVVDIRYANAKKALDNVISRDFWQVAMVGKAQIYTRVGRPPTLARAGDLSPWTIESSMIEP